jgi:hypothetical protein
MKMAGLKQISRINSPSGRGNDALAVLLQESPFLRFIDENSGWELDALNFNWLPTDITSKTLAARAVGSPYTHQTASPTTAQTGSQAIYGAAVDIDIANKDDADQKLRGIDQWFIKELRYRIKQIAAAFELALFTGTGQDSALKGLSVILNGTTALPGYTGVYNVADAQEVTGGSTVSCDLKTNRNNDAAFCEWLYLQLSNVDNIAGLVMNPAMAARLSTIGKNLNYYGEGKDSFGIPYTTFAGVPIKQALSTSILNTEDDDTDTTPLENTTSIYLMSPGEQKLSIVSNCGLYYKDYPHMEAAESVSEKMELRGTWKIEDTRSIRRIRNIKI